MPRPTKQRRVCGEPVCRRFEPVDQSITLTMKLTMDEFETIRLIDHEGLDQQACAQQMNVARTTVQAIYGAARAKLAAMLVDGLALEISEGDIQRCDGTDETCRACCKRSSMCKQKRSMVMRIAVTYQNGEIFQHFGHTSQFKIYELSNGAVAASVVVSTEGSGHGALATFLKEKHVDTLICGGIGAGAQQALSQAGIRLYAGVSGNADEAVETLLKGTLRYVTTANCSHHHDHDHDHDCGSHGCGEHKCGHC